MNSRIEPRTSMLEGILFLAVAALFVVVAMLAYMLISPLV